MEAVGESDEEVGVSHPVKQLDTSNANTKTVSLSGLRAHLDNSISEYMTGRSPSNSPLSRGFPFDLMFMASN
jgi:hypothetical protein